MPIDHSTIAALSSLSAPDSSDVRERGEQTSDPGDEAASTRDTRRSPSGSPAASTQPSAPGLGAGLNVRSTQ